jgi:hypothetical protein
MKDTVKIRSFRSGLTLAGQLQQRAVPRIGPWVLGDFAPAGFRSRRGDGHDRTPVAPQNGAFPTYKATRVHHAHRRRGSVAARGARAAAGDEFLISLGRYDPCQSRTGIPAWLERVINTPERNS